MDKGIPIRSISRALEVLQVVNRSGALSVMEIAQGADIPYPTAGRIVQTLLHEGMLEREPGRKRYRPTALVLSLAHGFQDHSGLTGIAHPHIVALTKTHLWPISLTTRVGQMMVVRDCTHAISPMALNNYYPGATFPLLECASGHAYLAFTDEAERKTLLDGAPKSEVKLDNLTLARFRSGDLTAEIRQAGFATRGRNQFTTTPGRTSSVAAPIFRDGKVCATLTMVFFATALKISEAVQRYIPDLISTARRISVELDGAARTAA